MRSMLFSEQSLPGLYLKQDLRIPRPRHSTDFRWSFHLVQKGRVKSHRFQPFHATGVKPCRMWHRHQFPFLLVAIMRQWSMLSYSPLANKDLSTQSTESLLSTILTNKTVLKAGLERSSRRNLPVLPVPAGGWEQCTRRGLHFGQVRLNSVALAS